MDGLENVIKEFLIESHEGLDQMERDLVVLEQDPEETETLASIFRTIHNIKGTSGVLGFLKLESIAHAGENLLNQLRSKHIKLDAQITSVLLTMVDGIREILGKIKDDGNEGEIDYEECIQQLNSFQKSTPETNVEVSNDQSIENATIDAEKNTAIDAEFDQRSTDHVVDNSVDDEVKTAVVENDVIAEKMTPAVFENNIRVDVDLLDKLMNLVGELVLVRNQTLQYTSTTDKDATLNDISQRLNLITTELQEGIMKTRMQPIDKVWGTFPRIVRDLAVASGKEINLTMEGRDTELDRTIIEAIKDPLIHLLRNMIDHGIESPQHRVEKGKKAHGNVSLFAFHESGYVNIEISDDGIGIDPEKIKKDALQKRIITPQYAQSIISDREAINLIFIPGFSTSKNITNVSGRGVGMDVVKTNIEKIGGTVDVQSSMGLGTTFRLKIPLTLAIVPALIITSGGDRYAIPQTNVVELVSLEDEDEKIEEIHGAKVYRLRGDLLPLVYLNEELGVGKSIESHVINIAVVQVDNRQFGLVIDEINDTEEIVVKPLGTQLKNIQVFAGATLMGDGQVALILDVLGIARHAKVIAESEAYKQVVTEKSVDDEQEEQQLLLLFHAGNQGRMAIPISRVSRLEEFPRNAIEKASNYDMVQYRGRIMPLVHLRNVLSNDHTPRPLPETLSVVVHSIEKRTVGLVVDGIVDIVAENVMLQKCTNRNGILGLAVIQDIVTDILDIDEVIRIANPPLFEQPSIMKSEDLRNG